ncbi:tautomerase family protein [Camelimonas abortus]|uniref:Tautomerase family protein n=1 Tax=Camelimonas abortus TaxID=1017184 RepID=A0ABV7LB38_9HYPH
MPLWTIYCPRDAFTAEERADIARRITDVYAPFMPRFYVGVAFQLAGPDELFVGGAPARRFVRIAVDHVARSLPGRGDGAALHRPGERRAGPLPARARP